MLISPLAVGWGRLSVCAYVVSVCVSVCVCVCQQPFAKQFGRLQPNQSKWVLYSSSRVRLCFGTLAYIVFDHITATMLACFQTGTLTATVLILFLKIEMFTNLSYSVL